jgi:diguanylate cyclase (GGDEF)-like protein
MNGRRSFDWAIVLGCFFVLLTLIGGSWLVLERARQAALHAAEATLRNATLIVESLVNRELLQVDGALASLPSLLTTAAGDAPEIDTATARRLLRGLNFQAFAFRDIILLHPGSEIWASALTNSWNGEFPAGLPGLDPGTSSSGAAIAGPIRNPVTGDWVLLVIRPVFVPGPGLMEAVAEVPLPLISKLLSTVGEIPGLVVSLERRDGNLLLRQPYDEVQIGTRQPTVIGHVRMNGGMFVVPANAAPLPAIAIARASLYDNMMIIVSLDLNAALADWIRERDHMLIAVATVAALVISLAIILVLALRQRERSAQHIHFVARHDALTRLPNRVRLREKLESALAHARPSESVALLCLDLDQFKTVNDTLGHPTGDALLQSVANRLAERTRATDTVARLGGDEFAVVRTQIDRPVEAADFAGQIIAMLDEPFTVLGHKIDIGTSIGVALAPQDGTDPDQLLKNADLALYKAKQDGRGVYRLFQQEMDEQMQARRVLELDLRNALADGQLALFYQPLIGLQTRAVMGFEALIRWWHPTKGLVAPNQFIPLAEETGEIVPIGEWILRTACATAAGWPDEMKVAVNLSAVQFKSSSLVATVAGALRDSGLSPGRLELEITESVLLWDTSSTLNTLDEFHALGVRIAMDDFGTGYSSLGYLRRFPFDRIKIDQSFVRELGRQRDCDAIVRAVMAMGRELGMAVTAEGVETVAQLRALALAGCTDVQGYLFSRPAPEAEIAGLLRSMPSIDALLGSDLATANDARIVSPRFQAVL